jgi:hypothetical protein
MILIPLFTCVGIDLDLADCGFATTPGNIAQENAECFHGDLFRPVAEVPG